MIKTEIILGRPGSGKTTRIIEALNAHAGPSLLVSLENPADRLRRMGLKESVSVLEMEDGNVTMEAIVNQCRRIASSLVAIDNLELLPASVSLRDLQQELDTTGTKTLLITAHLRRDLKPASSERINSIVCNRTVMDAPNPDTAPGTTGVDACKDLLDTGIVPLVQLLNNEWIRTTASCEGHWCSDRKSSIPYIIMAYDDSHAERWDTIMRVFKGLMGSGNKPSRTWNEHVEAYEGRIMAADPNVLPITSWEFSERAEDGWIYVQWHIGLDEWRKDHSFHQGIFVDERTMRQSFDKTIHAICQALNQALSAD